MYFDFTVPIPDKNVVKITIKKIRYIYWQTGRSYNKNKGYSEVKRICIGKQEEGMDADKMYPNQNFFKIFPEYEVPERKSAFTRSSCLRIGSYIVIKKLIASLGIGQIIRKILGEDDGGLFLDFIAYSIITEGNAAQYYPDYAYAHPLFTQYMHIYSDAKVGTLLHEMTADASSQFLNEWNSKRDHRQKIYISYDSTNKNSQAGELEFVEFGHPKEDKGLPVFGYSVAYDRTNSIPLFYEQYPGSIIDVSQLTFMLDKAQAYGYSHATFILDRGYFSKSNIQTLDEKGNSFIIMVKGMHELVNTVIDEKRGTFESSRDCYIRNYSAYGTTAEKKLYADDTRKRYIHLYYSVQRASAERTSFEKKLDTMMDIMDRNKNTKFEFPESYNKYFNLTYDKDGIFLMYEEKKEIIEKELSYCGYFCIVTSDKMSALDALEIYKSRDENEKLFRGDKSYLGDKSMRVYSNESTYSKIFIEFVALIVRCKIYSLIRDAYENDSHRPNYATVPAAIRELEKIEMIRNYDGIYRLDHAVTKHQKEILKCFGLNAEDVKNESSIISEALTERRTISCGTKE